MKRFVFSVIAGIGMLAGAAFLTVAPTGVSQDAIQSSVTRTPELIDKAWKLPVAATFRTRCCLAIERVTMRPGKRCQYASAPSAKRRRPKPKFSMEPECAGQGSASVGLTLDELADVAQTKTRRKVSVLRNLTADEFREHMKHANDPGRRYIINFTREKIFGAGSGHHSPIGGYLEAEDLVFVLDVNEPTSLGWSSVNACSRRWTRLDGDKKRGLLLIE